jgi:hypothetical protein
MALREDHRGKVSENWVLRRIYKPLKDQMVRGWGKLHNEELHNF